MAVTETSYTGNGSTTDYSFTFPYLKSTDIQVLVDNLLKTAGTDWSLANATTVQFNSAPADQSAIKIRRQTNVDSLAATFYAGSAIKSEDLNDNATQNIYVAQEINDRYLDNDGSTITGNFVLGKDADIIYEGSTANDFETTLTVTDPTADRTITLPNVTGTVVTTGDTESVSTGMIANGTIINGDINASAEIEVSKLKDGTARQLLQTDSGGTGVEWTSNVDVPGTLDVTGATDLDSTLNVDGATTLGTTLGVTGTSTLADITGGAVITSGTSTSDTKVYSAKRAGEIFYGKDTVGEIQSGETWSAADDKVATTSAIDARIIDLVDDVGGFVPIANENSFPTTNPDVNNGAGTLVSIKALSEAITTGSGVTNNNSIAQTTAGTAVNIVGLTESTTYAAGFGMIVETTSTPNQYTFHRLVPKATEVTTVAGISGNVTTVAGISSNVTTVAGVSSNVTTVAGSITNVNNVGGSIANVNSVASNLSTVNDFAARYRVGSDTTDPTGSLDPGDLFFAYDSSTPTNSKLRVYNGSSWQDGVTATGNLVAKTGDTFTGDVKIDNGKEIRFEEPTSDGEHYTGFKAQAQAANVTYSLPAAAAATNKYLKTTSGDETVLEWGDASDTTYDFSVEDHGSSTGAGSGNDCTLRLDPSDGSNDDVRIIAGANVTLTKGTGTITIASTDNNTQVSIDDTPVDGVTNEAISSNWAYDHNAATGNGAHVPAAGSAGEFLKHDGTWGTPPGTTTFVGLTDTPGSLTANKHLAVNSGGSAIEFVDAPSGTITALNHQAANRLTTIGSTTTQLDGEANLTFDGSTLAVTGNQTVSKQISAVGYEAPAAIAADWAIAAANNAMYPGPMTVNSGVTVTVPASRTLTIV